MSHGVGQSLVQGKIDVLEIVQASDTFNQRHNLRNAADNHDSVRRVRRSFDLCLSWDRVIGVAAMIKGLLLPATPQGPVKLNQHQQFVPSGLG